MKKLNKFFAILVALAMMATLCVTSAFAAGTKDGVPYADEDEAKLVKWLVVPEGTAVPTVVNTFKFAPYEAGSSGVTLAELQTALPGDANGEATITVTSSSPKTNDPNDANTVYQAIDLPGLGTVTHPGVYAYYVIETASTITNGDPDTQKVEEAKSNEAYIVRYTVKNGQNGLEVANVTAQEATYTVDEDTDEVTVTPITGAKVNPEREDPTGDMEDQNEPETPENPDDDTFVAAANNGISFKNIYTKTIGEEPADPDDPTPGDEAKFALRVTKTVDGEGAPATSEDFPFTLTLTAAVGQPADASYTYRIFDANNELVKDDDDNDKKGTITCGTPLDFTLKNGEYLALEELPAGTRYAVEETMNNAPEFSAYKPSFVVTTLDTAYNEANSAVKPAATSADLGQSLAAQNAGKTILLTENAKDVAAYKNTYDKNIDTPTGILMNNLPFIVLALVAIGGLVAYVVVRRRDENA